MNIQDLKSNTTWQEASNTINNNNNKISLAITTLENARLKNKGYFTTVEKLNKAIPSPTIGSKAYVGTSEPYAIYIVENGVWVDSGYTGGDEIVAKITTDRIEDGAVTSEKIATSAFDSTLSVSGKIAPANVVGRKLTELDAQINGVTPWQTITPNETVGYYIKNNGSKTEWNDANMTEPISLSQGDILNINAAGISIISAVAVVNNDGTYTSKVTYEGVSPSYQDIQFVAETDCNVVVSHRNGIWGNITINIKRASENSIVAKLAAVEVSVKSVEDRAIATEEKVDEVKRDVTQINATITSLNTQISGGSTDFQQITPNEIPDHYINKSGIDTTWEGIYTMTEPIALADGETIKVEGAGIASVAAIAKVVAGAYTPLVLYEGTATTMQTKEYTANGNVNVVLSFRTTNASFSHAIYKKDAPSGGGIVSEVAKLNARVQNIEENTSITNVIMVGVGKDYSNLNDAIASIKNSSASNKYRVEVYEGEYETVEESKIVSGYKGLMIPDYVSIVGVGDRNRIVIKGTLPSGYDSFANTSSTINMMFNGNIENITIEATNLRYCNHDDGVNAIDVKQVYKDVKFVYNTSSVSGVTATCVGIGNEGHKEILFDNCLFLNPNISRYGILMHDNAAASQIEGGRIEVKNCIFKLGTAGIDILLSNSGGSHECYAILTSNAFTSGLAVTSSSTSITTNRWKVLAQGNKNYSLTKKQGMVNVDLTDDIISW